MHIYIEIDIEFDNSIEFSYKSIFDTIDSYYSLLIITLITLTITQKNKNKNCI